MRATVIIDNIAYNGIPGEWGLCIYIEYEGKKILLDAGASNKFLDNAKKIGVSIDEVDYAVLSHAHYDHANGMMGFFQNNSKAKFYIQKSVKPNCYAKKGWFKKYIGIPKKVLVDYPDRIELVEGDYKLCEGVYIIPHKTPELENIGKREMMYQRKNRKWFADDFSHEQSVVFDTDKGLVIFNSCSHGGAANIINEIAATFPDKRVFGLVGGFHLFNKSRKEIEELADKIDETGIEYICTGHCTKDRAYDILVKKLGDRMHQLHVDLVMEF